MSRKKLWMDYLVMTLGVLILAFELHFFKTPNDFVFGGVSGLSIVIASVVPALSVGSVLFVLNGVLLVVGFLFLGKSTGKKTVYCTVLFSATVWFFDIIFPITNTLSSQKFLELFYAVFLQGVGGALIFNVGATAGGTDILAAIIKKYTRMKISIALLSADFIIVLMSGLVFGVEILLYNVFGVIFKTFALEQILESLNTYKIFIVISEKSETIKKYIIEDLKRGVTMHKARGAYKETEVEVITTVLSRRQGAWLQRRIRELDPNAFITISNSSQIIGNGFLGFDD